MGKNRKPPGKEPKRERKKTGPRALPAYCDYSCPHASFADTAAVGACRREQGIYCTLFKAYNNKNSACIGKK